MSAKYFCDLCGMQLKNKMERIYSLKRAYGGIAVKITAEAVLLNEREIDLCEECIITAVRLGETFTANFP